MEKAASATASIPILVVVFLVICAALLVLSLMVLYVFPKRPIGKQLPAWAPHAAMSIMMLSLPVVMLLLTMIIFPCFWQVCK